MFQINDFCTYIFSCFDPGSNSLKLFTLIFKHLIYLFSLQVIKLFNQLNDCPIQNTFLQQQKFKVKIKLRRGRVAAPWVPSLDTPLHLVYTKTYNAGIMAATFCLLPDRVPKNGISFYISQCFKSASKHWGIWRF